MDAVISDGVVSTANSAGQSRQNLLNLLDSLVKLFNGADFESLMSMLALTCREDVVVKTCLAAPPSTNNRKSISVLRPDNRIVPYTLQENTATSIALVWLLLYSAHPDGVMRIIDKRICYHTRVLASSAFALNGPPKEPAPISIVEVVVILCGSCIVKQPLHDVLVLATSEQRCRRQMSSARVNAVSPLAVNRRALSNASTGSDDMAVAEVDTLTRLLATYLATPPTQVSSDAVHAGVIDPTEGSSKGQRRRYLIEFRLQFDEHDLVTHWTTTVLAAEPEELFSSPL